MRKKSIWNSPVDVMEFIFVLAIVLLKVFFYQPCLDCGGSKDILDLRICGQQSVLRSFLMSQRVIAVRAFEE